jgi:phage-related protein
VATHAEAVYVLHAFEKKTRNTSNRDHETGRERFRALGKLKLQDGKKEDRRQGDAFDRQRVPGSRLLELGI